MKLADTVEMMNSSDYKERFKAEYAQLVIRYYGLRNMLFDLDLNTLFKNIKNCSIIPIKFND